jgi:hypothetical protein
MKIFYLSLSIILTVLILILAFANFGASCSQTAFFPMGMSGTIIILSTSVLGLITGICYHAFISKVMETSPEEEDEDF